MIRCIHPPHTKIKSQMKPCSVSESNVEARKEFLRQENTIEGFLVDSML